MIEKNPKLTSLSKNAKIQQLSNESLVATIDAYSQNELNFLTLQQNLQNCLSIVDNEIMKNYISELQKCAIVKFDNTVLKELNDDTKYIQFFRITELVYQEDEFSVHKIATMFNALSNKLCTLVLMIQSDGTTNNFYLGVRSRGNSSTGTMKQLLEQSLLGLFPGSDTKEYLRENLIADLKKINIGCISSVTCIADYKRENGSTDNKDFIQGLEKFIYSMQGKAFTAICIANNLEHQDLMETRKEYERIYTLMSPFSNIQYNYSTNQSSGITESDTSGISATDSVGSTTGVNLTENYSNSLQQGTNSAQTISDTEGKNSSIGLGTSHTDSYSDGTSDSVTTNTTVGTYIGKNKNVGVSVNGFSAGTGVNFGVTGSVSRGKTHCISHTDSVSDSISRNLTYGINSSKSIGNTIGESRGLTSTKAIGVGTQYNKNYTHNTSTNVSYSKALAETFGSSKAVVLNIQNKSLINTLQRLEKQLKRLEECESIGMWDFAAYFIGESAAEAETAASMYRSLVSGNQTGLELSAVNTWIEEKQVKEISKYLCNFIHPVFRYKFNDGSMVRETLVDATALVSTNELAIQLGLPRQSVKGLPVIEHAIFAQEILNKNISDYSTDSVTIGKVTHFGKLTDTSVNLDVQSLSMHTFITGSTGSGKSNTIYQILSQLSQKR